MNTSKINSAGYVCLLWLSNKNDKHTCNSVITRARAACLDYFEEDFNRHNFFCKATAPTRDANDTDSLHDVIVTFIGLLNEDELYLLCAHLTGEYSAIAKQRLQGVLGLNSAER